MTEKATINHEPVLPAEGKAELQEQAETKTHKRIPFWVFLMGVVFLLAGAAIGVFLGYRAGIELRKQAQQNQVIMEATYQYQLGLVDLEAGRYETARKRFEYVISLQPDFPGAAEKYVEANMLYSLALTPTPAPTPTLEPTPDLRGEEEIFNQISQHLVNKEWGQAVEAIQRLRDKNVNYRSVDVDGMYYIALRFLGIENVSRGELEVGIYNLTLAERFAPLDVEAQNYRNWARMYLSAASFWGADWARVVRYFADIYPSLPNLRDASGMTAVERYRVASIRYGDQLMTQGLYCDAEIQYRNALTIRPDAVAENAAAQAAQYCANPPNQEEAPEEVPPLPENTPTLPGGGETPGETPSPTPESGG
ncbi:MAG: hypothetical protein ACOYXO_09730 [Chloroflexota bacterium]